MLRKAFNLRISFCMSCTHLWNVSKWQHSHWNLLRNQQTPIVIILWQITCHMSTLTKWQILRWSKKMDWCDNVTGCCWLEPFCLHSCIVQMTMHFGSLNFQICPHNILKIFQHLLCCFMCLSHWSFSCFTCHSWQDVFVGQEFNCILWKVTHHCHSVSCVIRVCTAQWPKTKLTHLIKIVLWFALWFFYH